MKLIYYKEIVVFEFLTVDSSVFLEGYDAL